MAHYRESGPGKDAVDYLKFADLSLEDAKTLRESAQRELNNRQEELEKIHQIQDRGKRREAIFSFAKANAGNESLGLCVRVLVEKYMQGQDPIPDTEISGGGVRSVIGNGWSLVLRVDKMQFQGMGKADFRTEEEEGGKKRQDLQFAKLKALVDKNTAAGEILRFCAAECPDVEALRIVHTELPTEILEELRGKSLADAQYSWFTPTTSEKAGFVLRDIGQGEDRRFWIDFLAPGVLEKLTRPRDSFRAEQNKVKSGLLAGLGRLFGKNQ